MLRRLPTVTLPLLAAFAVVALGACSSGSAPGWTYAPVPSASAAASGAASGGPSGSPAASESAAASAGLSAAPSAEASGSPTASGGGSTALTVTAPQGAATAGFDPKELEAPANTPFTVTFDNQDTTTSPHDWILKDPSGTQVQIGGDTSFFSGPAKRDYQVPALAPGAYTYVCQVHPAVMTGTLTIK